MKLRKLVQGLDFKEIKGSKEIEISGISSDSRTVFVGNLFIAKQGEKVDASGLIPQAIENGAVAVLCDHYNPFLKQATQLVHPDIRSIEAILANRFYQEPSKELFVFGVTGTNGKTTTTYLVKHLLDAMHQKCGLIGTVETIIGDKRFSSTHTTHDIVQNQKRLREMVEAGCSSISLEVSSHGLVQGRVDGIEFDVALLTNITPDHLDYHQTMKEYAAAKQQLFYLLNQSAKKHRCAIANGDDPLSAELLAITNTDRLFFGFSEKNQVQAQDIRFSSQGTHFTVRYLNESFPFFTTLIGRFNVYNLLGAICVGLHLGFSLKEMAAVFETFRTVPGRLERVESSRKNVFVDYAHTADALDNVLKTLREIAKGKIITVFGAGGGRDPGRRAGLAQAAEQGSDISVITSDNPRKEDPNEIISQILKGFSQTKNVYVEIDRKKAIEQAIRMAQAEDIVLIAGKGHERVQIFANHSVPFDDRMVALETLAKE